MKKLTALLLTLVMLLALVACGGNNSSANNTGSESNTNASAGADSSANADGSQQETAEITASHTEMTLTAFGESFRLLPVGAEGAYTVTYEASDDSVAVVSQDGTVTAAGVGETTVTMQVDAAGSLLDFACAVTCSWEENIPGLSRTDFTLKNAGDSFKLEALNILDGAAVIWATSDEKVAAVAEDGTVTAVGAGSATITATVDEGGETYDLTCIVRCSAAAESQTGAAGADLSFIHEAGAAVNLGLVEDAELIENFYPGLPAAAQECIVYMSMMGINNSEIVLVKTDDVSAVKAILQTRVDYMADGGGWYPATVELWATTAQIVTSDDYVLLAVGETAADVAAAFSANVK